MSKLTLPNKAYLVLYGENQELESQVKRMGERISFRILKAMDLQEAQDTLSKVKHLVAVLDCKGSANGLSALPATQGKFLSVGGNSSIPNVVLNLENLICSSIPHQLAGLIGNGIVGIAPKLMPNELPKFSKKSDYNLGFTNLVTCDSSAAGFSAKAVCEVNFNLLRQKYRSLADKADSQLVDLFGEYCNQLLGVINIGLLEIGLNPMISLPIGAELSAAGRVAQVDYMPMVRLVDDMQVMGVGVGVRIASDCKARWNDLKTQASDGGYEAF